MIARSIRWGGLVLLALARWSSPSPGAPVQDADSVVHLPAFHLRTLDHRPVAVRLNGEDLATTPCLWSITGAIRFDPRIPVGPWPPPGAVRVSSTERTDLSDARAELYVGQGSRLSTPANGLVSNDCVLFVNGSVGGRALRGALRLRVEGYRWIDYTPLENADGEHTAEFTRTLWFERTPDE